MKSFLRNATSKLYNVVSAPVVATRLKEIQEYIEACEQIRLDLDNEEFWSKA